MSKAKQQLVVMLFDLGNRRKPRPHEHDYVWVGDGQGGSWIRGVSQYFPVENERKGIENPLLAAMDEWDKHRRPGESCTNTIPAVKAGKGKL